MIAIVMKELRTYFSQMTGYIFLALMTLLTALFFVMSIIFTGSPNYHIVLSTTTMLFFILIPTLTMRLFADEVRNKTDQLLFTSPLAIWQIVVGKYVAASLLFIGAVGVTMLFPLMISPYGTLPVSLIVGSYVGYILMGLGFIAIGLFISVMTENQIIAAVGTAGAIFFIFILDAIAGGMPADANASLVFVCILILALGGILYNSTKNIYAAVVVAVIGFAGAGAAFYFNRLMFDAVIPRTLRWFSVFSRFDSLTRGILDLADIVFYVTFPLVFIYLTINIIEKRRWR
ncbi:MAG: ABC transporter permease subunit [Defluviitaleaceae bacterium]|nr:ABC transporter permease subunit [Defluviitaleaceae bacterium]